VASVRPPLQKFRRERAEETEEAGGGTPVVLWERRHLTKRSSRRLPGLFPGTFVIKMLQEQRSRAPR